MKNEQNDGENTLNTCYSSSFHHSATYLLTTRFERHKHNNQLIQAVGESVKEQSIIVIIKLHIANFSKICSCSLCLKDKILVAMYWIFKSPNFDITLNVPISVGLYS